MFLYDFECTFLIVKNTKSRYFNAIKNFYIINLCLLYKKALTKSHFVSKCDFVSAFINSHHIIFFHLFIVFIC